MRTNVVNGSNEQISQMTTTQKKVIKALEDHISDDKVISAVKGAINLSKLKFPLDAKEMAIKSMIKIENINKKDKFEGGDFYNYVVYHSFKELNLKRREQLEDELLADMYTTFYFMSVIIKDQEELEEIINYYPNKYAVNTSNSYDLFKVIGKEDIIRKTLFFYIDNYEKISEKIQSFKGNNEKMNIVLNNFLVFEVLNALGYAIRIRDEQKAAEGRAILENIRYQKERNKEDYAFGPGTQFIYSEYRADSSNY